MKRNIDFLFAATLAVSLFTPGILTLAKLYNGNIQERSVSENRRLTTPLQVADADGLRLKFQRIEELMEDQLSIRDDIRIVFNRLMVFLFKHSSHWNIILGHDGYWFNMGHLKNHLYRFESAGNSMPRPKVERVAMAYKNFHHCMKGKGILSTLIFIPTKPYLFPDKLPYCFRRQLHPKAEKSISKLVEAMRRKGCQAYYPLELATEMPEDFLYDRRSFHWQDAGAQLLLFRQFSEANPFEELSVFPVPLDDLEVEHLDTPFDISLLLGLGSLPYEKKTYSLPFVVEEVEKDDYRFLRQFVHGAFYVKTQCSMNKNGVRAILFTDSFGGAANAYISQLFQFTAFVNTNGLRFKKGIMKKMIEAYAPDVVVFIFNESIVSNPNMLVGLFSIDK